MFTVLLVYFVVKCYLISCVCSVPDSRIKLVEQELCNYLTQHLIDSVTFLLPNMYPPKPHCDMLSTGDCAPPPSSACSTSMVLPSLNVGTAKRTNSSVSYIRYGLRGWAIWLNFIIICYQMSSGTWRDVFAGSESSSLSLIDSIWFYSTGRVCKDLWLSLFFQVSGLLQKKMCRTVLQISKKERKKAHIKNKQIKNKKCNNFDEIFNKL